MHAPNEIPVTKNEYPVDEKSLGIPVTILTGFLGSGKTTLLNHILTKQSGLKAAVLVNEFGEVGIDNELIVSTKDNILELSNGCICCSINGELLEAVQRILEREEAIDYIILETTGLADPLPVAMTFMSSELRDLTRLDSIITLIDAENFNADLLSSQIVRSQLIYGDILLLNKCDLVSKERIHKVESALKEVKKDARILCTEHASIDLQLILSIGLFQTDQISEDVKSHNANMNSDVKHRDFNQREKNASLLSSHNHNHNHNHNHSHSTTNHENNEIEGFTSLSFQSEKPFFLRKFQYFLDNQLPPQVYRAKGILWFNESERRHIFHLAGKRFSINDTDWEGTRRNQLVLIGKELNHRELKEQLNACIFQDPSDQLN